MIHLWSSIADMASNLSQKGSKNRRAFIYCRISHDPSGKELAVARQEKDCRNLAKQNGWTVAQVFVDNDLSASGFAKKNRPAFDEMVQRLRGDEADILIAYDDSRFTRQTKEFENLIELVAEKRIKLQTCQGSLNVENSDGRFIGRLLMNVRQHETEKMSERMRRAHLGNAELGERHSPTRIFGYQNDKVTADRVESEFVRGMIQRAIDGHSCTQIAKWLNESGQRTVKGTLFQSAGVKKIITNPMIAGIQVYRGEILPDVKVKWDAIVSREEWHIAKAKVESRTNGRRGNPGTLLMGVVFCARCGVKMYRTGNRAGHERDGIFRCHIRENGGCSLAINAPKLETLVTDAVLIQLGDLKTQRRSAHRLDTPKKKDDPKVLKDELIRLAQDRGDGKILEDEWQVLSSRIRERLRISELDEFADYGADAQAMKTLDKAGKTLKDEWQNLALNTQQRLIRLVVDRVEISKGEKGKHFSENRVKILWKV